LARVERQIGVLEQLVGVAAVLRGERHADAGATSACCPQAGRARTCAQQAIREGQCGFALAVAGPLQDREFVPAEPRHQIGLARDSR
jgi:hypothetical protein